MQATATASTKVGPGSKSTSKAEKAPKEKKPKTQKIAYVQIPEVRSSSLDGNGRLTSMPVPFDPKLHKAPKRADFAGEHVFLNFRADVLDSRAKSIAAKATQLRNEAIEVQKTGDPSKRGLVKRAAKLKEQLAKLEEQLKLEGIDI